MFRRRDVPIAKPEQPHIKIGLRDILKTLIHGPLIRRDEIFHCNDMMPGLAQPLKHHLAIFF
ncbi:MAG: hypothetical protein NPIRA03_39790 [Nitrospirales bacterium]|nr:MAG: hypothetical protein NPIRA03_39790 [Nitrospirales bacterium]